MMAKKMADILCGVDIGATNITVCVADIEGFRSRVLQRTSKEGGEKTIPDQVISLIASCCDRCGIKIDDLDAVGISSAGPFRLVDGMVELECPNICGGLSGIGGRLPNTWTRVPLERYLKGRLPPFRIANDAVSGANAERLFGAGIGCDNFVYVTWSTGIGTGAFVDGRLISGKNGNAPHGGHIYLTDENVECGCGNVGHLEGLSSGMAIGLAYGKGMTAEEVFAGYHAGDEREKIIRDAARYLGRGLASINAVLDTEMFIIGGSVFLNNKDLLLPMLEEELRGSFPPLSDGVIIVPSMLGEYLGDVAGLSLVMDDEWIKRWSISRPWARKTETKYM